MESSHFLWRRLQASLGLLTVSVPIYLLNILFFAYVFQDGLPDGFAWPWAGVTVVLGLGWLGTGFFYRQPKPKKVLRRYELLTILFAMASSVDYAWFYILAFPHVPVGGQLVLSAFTAVMASLGAIALAPIPLAAGVWLFGILLGSAAALVLEGHGSAPGTWFLVGSLGVALGLLVKSYQKLFLTRLRAEIQATNQTQLVSLLLHDFGDGSPDWIWETDKEGLLKSVAPRFARQLGKTPKELEGRPLTSVLAGDRSSLTVEDEDDLIRLTGHLTGKKLFHEVEVPAEVGDQHRRWRLAGKPSFDEFGELTGWRGVGSDITEVQRLNDLNARLALLDNLTGLANRQRLQAVLHDHLSPREAGRPCGLILLDVQNFRMINEALGHDAGDALLRDVALRLRSRVPPSTLLARLGGDEFALVAPGAGDAALESLVSGLETIGHDQFLVDGLWRDISFHLGFATSPHDGEGAAELLKCAELALHEAKRNPTGKAVGYNPSFGQRAQKRLELQGELKIALDKEQFELHYQPQIRITDEALVGAEALVRWRHPVRGMVSPAEFIPALEETGLIIPVGLWILKAACTEALGWPAGEKVAVNVSAVQFASRNFIESVRGVLGTTGFPPARLELEITESVMAQDPKQVVATLQELRSLGISISLDDFGTGYSSLSYLRVLPLDKLKVDQSFVRVMGQDPNAAAIVRMVLELSRQLGLRTTAEGVELEEQRAQLAEMKCDSIQGYFYSKPLPAGALKEFRARRT